MFTVCPDYVETTHRESYAESITAESDIYEDPAIISEHIIPNIDPLDMLSYLVCDETLQYINSSKLYYITQPLL